jgi:pimeloyl-ACP methyl ester carboxylesterase
MRWTILTIAVSVYASLCLFFFVFQRSFIYLPTPATPMHDATAVLEVPGARWRLSTIQVAAEGPVSRLVLIAPFESILAIASRVAPFLTMRLLLRDPWQSWRHAPRVTCPTLILAASHDEIVPMSDIGKLFEAFQPGVATLRVIDGTDYNSVSDPEGFWNDLVEGKRSASRFHTRTP